MMERIKLKIHSPVRKIHSAIYILILCLVSTITNSKSMNSFFHSNRWNVNSTDDTLYKERVFIHLSNKFFIAGETMWLNAYCLNANTNQLSDLSKFLYLEIFNQNNEVVLQKVLRLAAGAGEGSITLHKELGTGNYLIRAYTNWMKNNGSNSFYTDNITIVNGEKSSGATTANSFNSVNFEFFPEGGYLIHDFPAKVGCKGTGPSGKGVNYKGYIFNSKGDTVTTFQPLKFGMGQFRFLPDSNQKYTSKIIFENGEIIFKELPDIYHNGYALTSEEIGHKYLSIKVRLKKSFQNIRTITVLIHQDNKVQFKQQGQSSGTQIEFFINDTLFNAGISRITVLDENNIPVCEKLYFRKPNLPDVTISKSKDIYRTRQKVDLSFSFPDDTLKDILNSSLSVFLIDSLENSDFSTLNTYLLLTSELKGVIESPQYYLTVDSKDTIGRLALENLLLVHGWKKYHHEEIRAQFLPETDVTIHKIVILDSADRPKPDSKILISRPGKYFKLIPGISNNIGEVNLPLEIQDNETELLIFPQGQDKLRYKYTSNFSSQKPELLPVFLNVRAISFSSLSDRFSNVKSMEVFKYKNAAKISNEKDTLPFFGYSDKVYDLDKYTRFPTMEEVFIEYIPEVILKKRGKSSSLRVVEKSQNVPYEEQPLLLFDGIPVSNSNSVLNYDPKKIKYIKVINKKYYFGPSTYSGIVSLHTYKGDLLDFAIDSLAVPVQFDGLSEFTEFYSPVYDEKNLNSRIPDFRHILYWNTFSGKVDHSRMYHHFYTGDLQGKYAIIFNAVSTKGKVYSTTGFIEVKNSIATK